MYSSVQPGTQIGVQVSPLVIELSAIIKLKIIVTSAKKTEYEQWTQTLTFSFDFFEFVSEYIDDIEVGDDHAKTNVTEDE